MTVDLHGLHQAGWDVPLAALTPGMRALCSLFGVIGCVENGGFVSYLWLDETESPELLDTAIDGAKLVADLVRELPSADEALARATVLAILANAGDETVPLARLREVALQSLRWSQR